MSGAGSFVERHGLWTKEQHLAAKDLLSEFKTRNIEVVRFSFPDQHGILRGKTLTVDEAVKVLAEGVTLTTTLLAKDSALALAMAAEAGITPTLGTQAAAMFQAALAAGYGGEDDARLLSLVRQLWRPASR